MFYILNFLTISALVLRDGGGFGGVVLVAASIAAVTYTLGRI